MKKLFVLFLLISLVPFTVGCWNDDDDNDAIAAPRSNIVVSPSVQVPNDLAAAASMRAAISGYEVPMVLNGKTEYPVQVKESGDVTTLVYSFSFTDTELALNSSVTAKEVTGTLTILGVSIPVKMTVSNLSTAAIATVVKTITVTKDNNTGKFVVQVAGETINQPDQNTVPDPDASQYIVSVRYGENVVSAEKGQPTSVTTLTPSFKVTMNKDVTAITSWEVKVTNVDSEASFTLTQTSGAITVTQSGKDITLNVVGETGKQLKDGATYEIQRLAGTVNGVPFGEGGKRYIKVVLPAQ